MHHLRTVAASAALFLALGWHSPSHAQEGPEAPAAPEAAQRVLVVPVSADDGPLANAATQLTTALGEAAGKSGASVETSSASRAQVTDLADCSSEEAACMQEMLDAVSADLIVLGSLVATEGGWILTLKQVRRGEADKVETHILQSGSLDAQIDDIANKTFGISAPAPVESEVKTPVSTPTPTPTPGPSSASSFSLSKVDGKMWGITGAGAAIAVAGGVFLAVASGKQSGVDDAPDSTLDDINRLRDLEKTADRYELLGNSLLIAGGVTFAVGATLAILQARSSEESETPAMVIAPSPTEGGAMVNLTLFR
jgi:hypothetical protein